MSLYIADKIKIINNDLLKGLDNNNLESLESAKVPLNQLSDHIREAIQGHLRENIKEIIKKLRKDKDISGEDLKTIEKWMIGDAEYYTKIENNFKEWVNECKRLCNTLAGYTSEKSSEDVTSLFTLNALLIDLRFTLEDVIRYLDFSNRVNQFMDSINSGTINKEDKKILADLIEQQLYSEEF